MREQELNKKLAEWAGLCFHEWEVVDNTTAYPYSRCRKCKLCGKSYSTETDIWELPECADGDVFFDESLDACFKWLVPKLIEENRWDFKLYYTPSFPGIHHCHICDSVNPHLTYYKAQNKKSALAFCKAIEQLIDREEEKYSNA